MIDDTFSYPPTEYLAMREEQPDERAWGALKRFASRWNAAHCSQFVDEGDELSVTLPKGVRDPERGELAGALAELTRLHGCVTGRECVKSRYRGAAEYVTADVVAIVGEGPPLGFVANEIEAFRRRVSCDVCGREGRSNRARLVTTLRIREELLEPWLAASGSPPPDLLNLGNGGFLVSSRLARELASCGAKGYSLTPVLRGDTDEPSAEYLLLAATTAIVNPCPTHTPTTGAPCTRCGQGGGSRLGELHVEEPLVRSLDVFARDPDGFGGLHVSRDLYRHLLEAGMTGVLATGAMDRCEHEPPPERRHAVTLASAPPRRSEPAHPRPRASVDTFLRFVRAKDAKVDCVRAGRGGARRTFAVASMVEPGASAAELDALEKRFPDAAYLRPLTTQADGILMFHQSSCPPEAFPTRAAIDASQGAVCVPAAMRFEKACDWPALHDEVLQMSARLDSPFLGLGGVPFATIEGSSDVLVCKEGVFYYFSPLGNGYHNQVVARTLEGLLGLLTTDLAAFLRDTAGVTTYWDADGEQYVPETYHADG
jgi:hypothetical protein